MKSKIVSFLIKISTVLVDRKVFIKLFFDVVFPNKIVTLHITDEDLSSLSDLDDVLYTDEDGVSYYR